MAKLNSYKELEVWRKSVALVTEIYAVSKDFPSSEMYGIISQIRRAAVSVPSNIAEGWGRENTKSYIQFLRISKGSLNELITLFQISLNLKYLDEHKYNSINNQLTELAKMMNAMIGKLSERLND